MKENYFIYFEELEYFTQNLFVYRSSLEGCTASDPYAGGSLARNRKIKLGTYTNTNSSTP